MSFLPDDAHISLPLALPFPTYITISMVGLGLASVFGFGAARAWRRRVDGGGGEETEPARKEEEMAALRRAMSARQEDINAKAKEIALLLREAERMRDEMRVLEERLIAALVLNEELGLLRSENARLGDENRRLEGDALRLGMEHRRLTDDKRAVDLRLSLTTQLLDTRTAELKGAHTFLGTADAISGAEVIALVEALNAEILQTAAVMAESFTFSPREPSSLPDDNALSDETRDAHTGALEILGARMVRLLRSSAHDADPVVIQLAFQAGIAAYAHWVVSSWYFEDPEDEHLLSEIYARVRESEEQAISGRWRALTRTHLQRMLAHEPDLSSYMVTAIVHILITAGVTSTLTSGSSSPTSEPSDFPPTSILSSPNLTSSPTSVTFTPSPSTLHAHISRTFLPRLTAILRAAVRLNVLVGAGVTSCDLEAFYVAPDVPFDAGTMEDAFGLPIRGGERDKREARMLKEPEARERGKEAELVLCTTDLGLVRAERKAGKEAEWHEAVLLRPKVVLESGLVLPEGDGDGDVTP